jgi:hypothetical protein
MKRSAILAVVALFALGVAGCGERDQTALYKDGKYRGKPDMRSWDNGPLPYGSTEWKKGDRVAWENEVRRRSTAQNEYRRIGR